MKLNFEEIREDQTVECGDVVITDEGNRYLIIRDDDGDDYRALNLETFVPSDFRGSIANLFEYEVEEEIKVVIKSNNLELRKC